MLQQPSKQEVNKSNSENRNCYSITPDVNIFENTEETQIVLDIPGVDEKSVDISYEKDILTIEGKNSNTIPEGYESMGLEFKTGDYIRKFRINKPMDLENSKAVIKNGRLTLLLPKVLPITRKIRVNAG